VAGRGNGFRERPGGGAGTAADVQDGFAGFGRGGIEEELGDVGQAGFHGVADFDPFWAGDFVPVGGLFFVGHGRRSFAAWLRR
jgi:hypothetical protein